MDIYNIYVMYTNMYIYILFIFLLIQIHAPPLGPAQYQLLHEAFSVFPLQIPILLYNSLRALIRFCAFVHILDVLPNSKLLKVFFGF